MTESLDAQSNDQGVSPTSNTESSPKVDTPPATAEPVVPAPQPAANQPVFAAYAQPAPQSAYPAAPAAAAAYPQRVTYNTYQPAPIVIAPQAHGPNFLVRAVWFVFIGWWLTGITIGVAYFAALTIIGLPLGFYLFNRIPTILTLRPSTQRYEAVTANGVTMLQQRHIEQHPLWLRAVYFVCLGWWLGALWMGLAYFLCVIIIGMPFGVMMFDRVGGIMTLHRH